MHKKSDGLPIWIFDVVVCLILFQIIIKHCSHKMKSLFTLLVILGSGFALSMLFAQTDQKAIDKFILKQSDFKALTTDDLPFPKYEQPYWFED